MCARSAYHQDCGSCSPSAGWGLVPRRRGAFGLLKGCSGKPATGWPLTLQQYIKFGDVLTFRLQHVMIESRPTTQSGLLRSDTKPILQNHAQRAAEQHRSCLQLSQLSSRLVAAPTGRLQGSPLENMAGRLCTSEATGMQPHLSLTALLLAATGRSCPILVVSWEQVGCRACFWVWLERCPW